MEFVALDPKNWAFFWTMIGLTLVAGVAIAAGAAAIASSDGTTPLFRGKILPVLGILLGICAAVWTLGAAYQADQARWDKRDATVIDQIKTTYGEDYKSIGVYGYPKVKPTEDFRVFGSSTTDEPTASGFERTETFLVWKDGEMILATSSDGEVFDELTR